MSLANIPIVPLILVFVCDFTISAEIMGKKSLPAAVFSDGSKATIEMEWE